MCICMSSFARIYLFLQISNPMHFPTTAESTDSSTIQTEMTDSVNTSMTTKLPKTQRPATDVLSSTSVAPSSETTTVITCETTRTQSLMSMTITIDGEYDEVVGVDKQKFLNDVKRQLANYLRLPLFCIVDMDSKPGTSTSIIVIFEMIPSLDPNFPVDQNGLKAAKQELEEKIRTNRIHIIDSRGTEHRVLFSVDNSGSSGQRNENTGSTNHMSYLIMGLAVGSVVIMIVLIIITACAVRSYMYSKFLRQIRPRTTSMEMLNDMPSRDGIPSVNTLRMLTGISREGANSLGVYSYDSGVWVGAGPEPDISVGGVPEPSHYLPPNDAEISITPKPPPEVVCH